MHITGTIDKIVSGSHLTRDEARAVMQLLLSGSVGDEHIVAFLAALRDKGEHPNELVGFAEVMREHAAETLLAAGGRIERTARDEPLLDTCGTGGDALGTFNVSTAAALVAAAGGVRVGKHGNRSISSRCGSADVLEALGVRIELPPERIAECLDTVGCVFLYAPQHHAATRHVMNARRAMRTKTVFNLLGPLTNPLGATVQLTGVFDHARTEIMAEALARLGTHRAMVVAAWDGMDEVSTTGTTRVSEATAGTVTTRELSPEDFGLPRGSAASIEGGDAVTNAQILMQVFGGASEPYEPYRDAVLVNTSAALVAAGRAQSLPEGVTLSEEAIRSGAAARTLARLVEFTQRSAGR